MASTSYYPTFDLNDSSCVYPFESSANKQNFLALFLKTFYELKIEDFNVLIHFTVCEMLKLIIADREAMVQESNNLRNENHALATAATEIMKKVDDVNAYFIQEQEKMKALNESNQRLLQQLDTKTNECAEIQKKLDNSREEIKKLKDKRVNDEAEISVLQKKLDELQKSKDFELKRNQELNVENEKLATENGTLTVEAETQITELYLRLEKLQQSLDSAKRENHELIAGNKKLTVEAEAAAAKPEINSAGQPQEEERLQNSEDSMTEQNQKRIVNVESTKYQLHHASKKINLLNEVVLKQQKELEENKITIQELKTKQEDVDSIKKDFESMKQKYEEYEKQIQEWKAKEERLEVAEKRQKAFEKTRHINRAQMVNSGIDAEAAVGKGAEPSNGKRPRNSVPRASFSGHGQFRHQHLQQQHQQQQYLHRNYPPPANHYYGFPQYPGFLSQNIFINNEQHPLNYHEQNYYPQMVFNSCAPQYRPPHQQPPQ